MNKTVLSFAKALAIGLAAVLLVILVLYFVLSDFVSSLPH
jgi:hypothetical protein